MALRKDTQRTARLGRGRLGKLAAATLASAFASLAIGVQAGAATPAEPGKVNFLLNAKSAFDPYVSSGDSATQEFVQEKYWRARAYPPFFDRALDWSPPTSFYKDLYAIYEGEEEGLIDDNPAWVLRDAGGKPLYIDYDCGGGSCPQYAADVGNPAWRAYWIADVVAQMEKGYIGVFVDDVNLEMRVSDGYEPVRPIDPRTGDSMTDEAWRRYMAEFLEEIRAAIPEATITHNSHWWLDHEDPYVKRQVDAADVIELERGFSDEGITGGGGTYGYETFLEHIDWLHGRGKSIVLEPYGLDRLAEREYELASYFLVQEAQDAISSDDRAYPDNWWAGWETNLGAPRGSYHEWRGLMRRKFANGVVLVNQPGASSARVKLGRRYTRLSGKRVRTVRLGERSGAVLLRG